ncbi:MAG: hypothetical protein F2817_08150 [Actinobacteria bacterium]|nr:hypothetical protein [Actinomycetota bacterium]
MERLDRLANAWMDGMPPTPQEIEAVVESLARLRVEVDRAWADVVVVAPDGARPGPGREVPAPDVRP